MNGVGLHLLYIPHIPLSLVTIVELNFIANNSGTELLSTAAAIEISTVMLRLSQRASPPPPNMPPGVWSRHETRTFVSIYRKFYIVKKATLIVDLCS